MPPQLILIQIIQMFLSYALAVFYHPIRLLGLHRVWFGLYHLISDEHNLDLENTPSSLHSYWSETIQKMKKLWTLVIMVSSLITTLSLAFLQIDKVLSNIYLRTFAILACILSSASLAASCVFIANGESLDRIDKSREWELASKNPNTLSAIEFWTCLALPLTSLAWSVGFCLIPLFSLVWIDQGADTTSTHTSKVDLALNSTLVALVVLFLAFQFYRIRRFIEI